MTKKIILMVSWALTGGYFVIASNGGGGATCAIMSFACGFMVARNMADIVTYNAKLTGRDAQD